MPSCRFLSHPGLFGFYSTAPTPEGYYQLAPIVSVHPVMDMDYPVHSAIRIGDLLMLQHMLASGKVYLRSLCPDGKTLLHVCILQHLLCKITCTMVLSILVTRSSY